ncbi:MAG: Spy/CpxP family protein refolding chaperone [Ignavibacteriaceae bacterium]|nr:Spy/CpxP family protein refolding chaperone [Ignavibacteriaceae bacterium]
MKHFMIFSFALAFLVLQAPLDAQGRGPRDDRPRPGYNMIEKLDLSDAQKDKIEQLRLDHQKQMIDLRAALDKERLAMKELMANDNLNRSAYLAQEEKLNAARDKMQKARANHQMDIYDQLNADQKKIWREFHGKWGFEGNKNFRRGGRGPGKRGPGFGPCFVN